MTPIDIPWLLGIVGKAGEIALSHFGRTKGTLKSDNSWVTQADLDVEAYLRKELASTFPDDAVLGEEGDDPPPTSSNVWAIDPIDGTRAFNHGLPVWGVSIGLLINGRPPARSFSRFWETSITPTATPLSTTALRSRRRHPFWTPTPCCWSAKAHSNNSGSITRARPSASGRPRRTSVTSRAAVRWAHSTMPPSGTTPRALPSCKCWAFACGISQEGPWTSRSYSG